MSQKIYNTSLILLLIYLITGIYLSLNTGISHDEYHEQLNWEINLKAIKNFFETGYYNELLEYKDRFHGIGFNFLSQPFQYLIKDFVLDYLDVNEYGSILISKHPIIFILFFISGLFFYKICLIFFNKKNFALISLFIFLLYPYFLGHSLINPKDIPFLSFWIISTYVACKIIKKLNKEESIPIKYIVYLSISASFLISIRIVGILILLQFLIFIITFCEIKNKSFLNLIKNNIKNFFILFFTFVLFLYFLNPIFWHDPREIINSLKWMSKYQQDVSTLTLGEYMKALNLPANYYFIWLFFKLPILIILGFLLFPFIEKKFHKNNLNKILTYSVIFTCLIILFLFILFEVAIYNEIRHVMFLIPLIFIVSLNNLYLWSKKFYYFTGVLVIIFFVVENISINPYQYTWMNSFSKFYKINKNFEVDYWGISNKSLYTSIDEHSSKNNFNKNNCVYGDLYSEVFLESQKFKCFKMYSELDAAKERPYYVMQNHRNLKRSNPKDCKQISSENYNYSFSNQKIKVGSAWYCD